MCRGGFNGPRDGVVSSILKGLHLPAQGCRNLWMTLPVQ